MEGRDRAELKDIILAFMLAGEDSMYMLYKRLNNPVKSEAHFIDIVQEMIAEQPNYISMRNLHTKDSTILLSAKPLAADFLKNGGFTKIFDNYAEIMRKENENATRETTLKELTEKELRQKIRYNKYALPLSIVSILIAIGGFIWSIYKPANNVIPIEMDI